MRPRIPAPVKTHFRVFELACTVTSCADVSAIFNVMPLILCISDACLYELVTLTLILVVFWRAKWLI
jgi:hypothetical protein